MGTDTTAYTFLQHGGNMGANIRAKDWSQTPLGTPDTWPASLKHAVQLMLENPFGMYIAWGKDYTQIYNDGYRPILGETKHPQALGLSSRETFSEIWHIIGSMFEDVKHGKAVGFQDFMLSLNRHGYVENCYFDFAYSPIRVESGEVGGVLVTVIETTHKKKVEDAWKESKNELEFVLEAAQLGVYDYNPLTHKFSCNAKLKEWFGLPQEENMVLSNAMDAIVERDRERVSKAISNVLEYASGGNYDVEYTILNPITKEEIIVHAKGKAWYNDEQIAYRLSGTVEDVTAHVLARQKIEESERNLRLMILQAPVAIAIFRGPDYVVTIANKFALEIWGRSEEQVLHTPVFEAMPELLSQGLKEYIDEVAKTGKRFATTEMPIQFLSDEVLKEVYINFSFEALYDGDGSINEVMAIGVDVTPQVEARKKVEESEQHIRALVESAPFPIGVYQGEELRITLANQSIMDIWGKGTDLIGKTYPEVLPELADQHIYDQLRGVLRTGKAFHAKDQRVDLFIKGKLTPYYFNYSFTPLYDASGKVFAVMNSAADVTELHLAKEKVEESEQRFKDSVKQAPIGIAIFRGPDYVTEMANESYLQIVDLTEAQFVGKPLFETLPEVEESVAPIIAEIYKTGKDFFGYEFPVTLKRHGKIDVSYFNFVYHPLEEHNVISGFMVVVTEVTAAVEARQLIEENEEKLQLIIECSELGIFDADLKTGKVIASDRCYEILGFDGPSDMTQEAMTANMHPEDLLVRKQAFEKAFKDGSIQYQSRILGKDNTIRWMDARGKVFFDTHGAPERVLGTVRDITEERNFQQELLEREEKFRLLADSMPQYIWTADPEGNIDYFNQSLYDYGGYSPGELLNDEWVKMVHPDDRDENMKQWMHAVKNGTNYLFEQRFKKHDGEYRWQLSRAIPQLDADGVIKRWVGTSTDIQEQKMFTVELEKQVRQRTKELEQNNIDLEKMNKELQSFVYISSHDLQEPLRKIQTFSSRVLDTEYETLSATGKQYFERMQNSALRMQNLIQDLIAYSRANVQDINYDIVDLGVIIDDLKETLSEELEQHQVNFQLHNICEVRIISVQFQQVLQNLITNSIKFARIDHPLEITINCEVIDGESLDIATLTKHKAYCHIRYSDNGIGFEPDYNEKIFEVFQRLHSKDEYTGTGIGLAIVKRIIDNHEGVIIANGLPNVGATFDIYIPSP